VCEVSFSWDADIRSARQYWSLHKTRYLILHESADVSAHSHSIAYYFKTHLCYLARGMFTWRVHMNVERIIYWSAVLLLLLLLLLLASGRTLCYFLFSCTPMNSSVSIVSDYRLDDWVAIPGRGKGFFF
jgi:hypothetical protein